MKIRVPVSEKRTREILDSSEEEIKLYPVVSVDNFFLNTELKVVARTDLMENYYFYVLHKNRIVACVEYENNTCAKNILKLKKYQKIYIPHAAVDPNYRRLNICTNLYLYFLLNVSDAVLMSYNHTKSAKLLWQSVSNKTKFKIIYHNLLTGKQEEQNNELNIKLLVPS